MDDEQQLPCADKLVFESQAEAQASATVAQHTYGNSLSVYRCQYCDLWHIASNY